MMRKALALLFAVTITAFFGAWGIHRLSQPHAPEPSSPIPVRLGISLEPGNVLMMVAVDKGLLLQEGLRPVVGIHPSGKAAMEEGLFKGQSDFVTATDIPAALSAFARQDYKVIAVIFQASNINRIVARRDAGIEVPGDLRGKKISTQKGSAIHYFLDLALAKHSITPGQTELSLVTPQQLPGLPAELAEGKIDAISVREPFTSEAKALLGKNAVVFEEPGLYSQFHIIVARESLLREHPEIAVKLLRALIKAATLTSRYPGQAKAVMASWLGISIDKAGQLWPVWKPRIALEPNLLIALRNAAVWGVRENLVARREPPSYDGFIDDGMLKRAATRE